MAAPLPAADALSVTVPLMLCVNPTAVALLLNAIEMDGVVTTTEAAPGW